MNNPDEEVDGGIADEGQAERMPGDEAHLARDDDPPHPEADEAEGEEAGDEEADDNPLHVLVKENHADELVDLLNRYGYTELAEAFRSAEVGETIEVKVVED